MECYCEQAFIKASRISASRWKLIEVNMPKEIEKVPFSTFQENADFYLNYDIWL